MLTWTIPCVTNNQTRSSDSGAFLVVSKPGYALLAQKLKKFFVGMLWTSPPTVERSNIGISFNRTSTVVAKNEVAGKSSVVKCPPLNQKLDPWFELRSWNERVWKRRGMRFFDWFKLHRCSDLELWLWRFTQLILCICGCIVYPERRLSDSMFIKSKTSRHEGQSICWLIILLLIRLGTSDSTFLNSSNRISSFPSAGKNKVTRGCCQSTTGPQSRFAHPECYDC